MMEEKKEASGTPQIIRRHYRFCGSVQGVGFRYRAMYAARELYLTGWVRNNYDGSVEMEVQGKRELINHMLPMIRNSDWVYVTDMTVSDIPLEPYERGFRILDY